MKTTSKRIVAVLFGFCGTALLMHACSPGTRASRNYLDTAGHHVQSGMKLLELEKYDDAVREFSLARELDPGLSGAYVGSGLVFGHKGDFVNGIQYMETAVELSRNEKDRVEAYVGLIRLYARGKGAADPDWLGRAERAYEAAVESSPRSSAARYYMGEAYGEALAFDRAVRLFKKVVDMNGPYVVESQKALRLIEEIQRETKGL